MFKMYEPDGKGNWRLALTLDGDKVVYQRKKEEDKSQEPTLPEQEKQLSQPVQENINQSEMDRTHENISEIPSPLLEVPQMPLAVENTHSVTNNVQVVRTVNARLAEGVEAGKNDPRNEMREIPENPPINPAVLSAQTER